MSHLVNMVTSSVSDENLVTALTGPLMPLLSLVSSIFLCIVPIIGLWTALSISLLLGGAPAWAHACAHATWLAGCTVLFPFNLHSRAMLPGMPAEIFVGAGATYMRVIAHSGLLGHEPVSCGPDDASVAERTEHLAAIALARAEA